MKFTGKIGLASLAKNVGYNMISQVVALIVPLVTAPYISRVFNAEIIGQYQFALANSSYFVLIESLGFELYGTIRIASVRNDRDEVSRTFFEITILRACLMIFSILLFVLLIVPHGDELQTKLNCIMLMNIFASGIHPQWFLSGMEDFKTIALKNIFVRLANIVGILCFIKSSDDLLLYAFIMQGANLLSALLIYPYVLRFVTWVRPKRHNMFGHLKQGIVYSVSGIVATIFSSTDKTMLGTMCGEYEVGIYDQAHKITQICMSAISAIGNVIVPRATYLFHNSEDKSVANRLVYQSFEVLCLISFPIMLGICVISREFIPSFYGPGYEKSIPVLMILAFTITFTSWGNLIGQQCLLSRDNIRGYNLAVVVAAFANIVLNYFFIRQLQSVGAAIASVTASVVSTLMLLIMSSKAVAIKPFFKNIWKFILSSGVMMVVVYFIQPVYFGTLQGIILRIGVGALIYVFILFLVKEKSILSIMKRSGLE